MHIFADHYSAYHNRETGLEAEAVGMDGDQGCVWVVILQVMKERAEIWGPERPSQDHYEIKVYSPCKIKMQGPLFKNYSEFQEGDSRALKQVQALLSTQITGQEASPGSG